MNPEYETLNSQCEDLVSPTEKCDQKNDQEVEQEFLTDSPGLKDSQWTEYQTFYDLVPGLYFCLDKRGKILTLNQFGLERLSWTQEDLIGQSIYQLIPAEVLIQFQQKFSELLTFQSSFLEWESQFLTRNEPRLNVTIRGIFSDKCPQKTILLFCQEIASCSISRTEIKLNNILNHVHASIAQFQFFPDKTWIFDYFSPAYEDIFGYTPEELLAEPYLWISRVFPEDIETVFPHVGENIFAEKRITIEYRFFHKNNSIFWISSTFTSYYDSEQNLWIVTVISTDISDCKYLESALKNSKAQLQDIINNAVAAIISFCFFPNRTWEYNFYSKGCEIVFGYKPEELMADKYLWFSRVFPEDQEQVLLPILDLFLTEKSIHIEYRFYRKDGSLRWISDTYTIRYDPSISGYMITTIATDITAYKSAEKALKASENRFRQLAETIGEVFYIVDANTRQIIYVSPAYEKLWERSCQSLYEHPHAWLESIHSEDYDRVLEAYNNLFDTKFFQDEYRLIRSDGSICWIFDRNFPIYDNQGNLLHFVGLAEDVTERKKAEETLRKKAEKEQIFNRVTQRIRQSLNLEDILLTTVTEIRELLQADRVLIYRIELNGEGRVLTEAIALDIPSLLGVPLPKEIFPKECFPLYRQGRIRTVIDIETDSMSPCLVETLRQIEVRSKMVVPILASTPERDELRENLWGLLIAHQCYSPREWLPSEVDLLKQLASQVGIGIQQSYLYQQTELQAQRQHTLNQVIQAMRRSLDLDTIFATTVSEVGKILQIDRVSIVHYVPEKKRWIPRANYSKDETLRNTPDVEIPDEENILAQRLKNLEIIKIDDVSQISDPINQPFATRFPGSWLLIPLEFNEDSSPPKKETVWGSLTIMRTPNPLPWENWEVELLSSLANQLSIAIHQSELYQKLGIANQELHRQATRDGLTQIANRRYFDEYLNSEWKNHALQQKYLSLILLDVDYFKRYNDTYGHLAGDDCLRQVARVLSEVITGSDDLVARYGGEEFAIILPETDAAKAVNMAEMIRQSIRSLYIPHQGSLVSHFVTVSVGIATVIPSFETRPQYLIDYADQALYTAKGKGRDCSVNFHYGTMGIKLIID